MIQEREEHWLFLIRTEDRPGAAAAIAMVFSGRGIQIESFLGYGNPTYSESCREGVIVITFFAFRPRMEMVRRIIQRLEVVRRVDCYDYASTPGLLKTAMVRLSHGEGEIEEILRGFELRVSSAGSEAGRSVAILSGRPVEVDRAMAALGNRAWLLSAVYAFLPPAEMALS